MKDIKKGNKKSLKNGGKKKSAPLILNTLCRGLVGYISYLATCQTSPVYSEYLLYEPFLRIVRSQGFSAKCEVPVPDENKGKGDHKRIDFLIEKGIDIIAIEIKWIRGKNIDIRNDTQKLQKHLEVKQENGKEKSSFVLLFGKMKYLEKIKIHKVKGIVSWNAGKTKYAAGWIEVLPCEDGAQRTVSGKS